MFERISASSSTKLTRQLRFNIENAPYEEEFSEVSINMVDRNTSKQPALEPENSATPRINIGIRSRSSTARPVNYIALAQGRRSPRNTLLSWTPSPHLHPERRHSTLLSLIRQRR